MNATPGLWRSRSPVTQPLPATVWTGSGSTAGAKIGPVERIDRASTSVGWRPVARSSSSHAARGGHARPPGEVRHVGVLRACPATDHPLADGAVGLPMPDLTATPATMTIAGHRAEQHLLETSQVVLLSGLIPRRAIGAVVVRRRRMHDPSAPLALAPSRCAPRLLAPLPAARTAGHTVVARVTGWLR